MTRNVTVAIDASGRLTLPKAIRDKAGMVPGIPFEVTVHDGSIELKPVKRGVRLLRRGRLTVAAADDDLPPLTEREVREVREQLRESRSGG